AERPQWHDSGRNRTADRAVKFPLKKIWCYKSFREKTKPLDHAGPAPTLVRHFQNIHLQNIAGLGPLHENRSGERMNAVAVDKEILRERRGGMHLRAGRIHAFKMNRIA